MTDGDPGLFVVAALVVATVSSFIGAHMMAETAAFISHSKQATGTGWRTGEESGERLFLLATFNIFLAIMLILFALMLLPKASGKVQSGSLALISSGVFGAMVIGAFVWMFFAIKYRAGMPQSELATLLTVGAAALWTIFLLQFDSKPLLFLTFVPITMFAVGSLIYFAVIFRTGEQLRLRRACIPDLWCFRSGICICYGSLIAAGIRMMLST
jgi:hypothetical protein